MLQLQGGSKSIELESEVAALRNYAEPSSREETRVVLLFDMRRP